MLGPNFFLSFPELFLTAGFESFNFFFHFFTDLTSLNSQAHDQINVSTFCLDSAFPPTTKDVNDWISQMKNVQRIPHPGIEAKGMATNESKDKDLEQKNESTVKTELELSQA